MTKEKKIKSTLNKGKAVYCYIKGEYSCILGYTKVKYSGYKMRGLNPFTLPIDSTNHITFK